MTAEMIREWMNRRPFVPFVLKLESGESHPIRHPEFLILMSKHIGIGSPDSDGVQQYELAKVTSVEALVSA